MRVRMVVKVSGSRDGARWPDVGGELDVAPAEGAGLCMAGLAVAVDGRDEVVTAAAPEATDTATLRRPRRRKAGG